MHGVLVIYLPLAYTPACIHTHTYTHTGVKRKSRTFSALMYTYIHTFIHTHTHTQVGRGNQERFLLSCKHTYIHTYIHTHRWEEEIKNVFCSLPYEVQKKVLSLFYVCMYVSLSAV
jgi:hypothetical protein